MNDLNGEFSRIERFDENLGALDVTLSDDDLATLEGTFPRGAGQGLRYPAGALHRLQL